MPKPHQQQNWFIILYEPTQVIYVVLIKCIWAVLFLILLFFQLKDSKARETKYQKTIESLGKSLEIVNDVKQDVEDIKNEIRHIVQKDVKNEKV